MMVRIVRPKAAGEYRRQLPAAMLATALLLSACQAAPSAEPGGELSYLFSQTADLGRLEPRAGDDAYTLVLTGVDPHTVQFTDRPARRAGVIPTTTFVAAWGALFGDDPPNAALVEHAPGGATDTLVLTLSDPVYNAAAAELRYAVVVLADEQHPERLVGVGGERHGEPLASFGTVSVFIDNAATPPSTSTCVLEPGGQCSGANLAGANISWLDLSGADLSRADLSGAYIYSVTLADANLSGANLTGAVLWKVDARRANLSGSNLSSAYLGTVYLANADLSNADLNRATLDYFVNLLGADLTGVSLLTTKMCSVTMPDGSLFPAGGGCTE